MKLELSFTLNSFKISEKSPYFSVKILNFLKRSASPPEPHIAASNELLSFVLGGQPANFRNKTEVARGKFRENHKNSLASQGSTPEPHGGIEF